MEPQRETHAESRARLREGSRCKGQLLPFPKLKRPRGRPRKDRTPDPAPESFDVIATAIVGLNASEVAWKRAASAQRLAMQQRKLRPTTIAAVDYVTEWLNRNEDRGYDWHSTEQLADLLEVTPRSVKRAFEEAANAGFVKRRRCGSAWHTTLPRMVGLCIDAKRQFDADQGDQKGKNKGTRKSRQGDQKIARGTRKPPGGPENAYPQAPRGTKKAEQGDRKGTNLPLPPSSPPYPPYNPHPDNPENNPISAPARAMNGSGFQEETASRIEPRFDRTLALRDRIDVAGAAGDDLVRKLAKGWDIPILRDQFCDWMALHPAPRNAQAAFLGWLSKTAAKREQAGPAAQERLLPPGALADQWAAEDALDAELRAPVWAPCGGPGLPQTITGLVSSVVGRVAVQGVEA